MCVVRMALILHPEYATREPVDVPRPHVVHPRHRVSEDIVYVLMPFLDERSVVAVGAVCKPWNKIADSGMPVFA